MNGACAPGGALDRLGKSEINPHLPITALEVQGIFPYDTPFLFIKLVLKFDIAFIVFFFT